jgi:hypothetical protein
MINYFAERRKEDTIKAIYAEYREQYPPLKTVEDIFNLDDMIIGEIVDKITDISPERGKILRMELQRLYDDWRPLGWTKVFWYNFENVEEIEMDIRCIYKL